MNIALVISEGKGSKIGGTVPKQYVRVNGRMIMEYCMATLSEHVLIEGIWVVAEEMWHEEIKRMIPRHRILGFSFPGRSTQQSVYNGLSDIQKYISFKHNHLGYHPDDDPEERDMVLIQEAFCPLLTSQLINFCFDAMEGFHYDGVIPTIPMKEQLLFSTNERTVFQTLDHTSVYSGQSPQLFLLDKYLSANADLMPDRIHGVGGTLEPAIMAGMNIKMVPGDIRNIRIHSNNDVRLFQKWLREGN